MLKTILRKIFREGNGISQSEARTYWSNRAKKQGASTVGFSGHTLIQQEKEYQQKIDFVMSHIEREKKTVEYGCGIGRWSDVFECYVGMDITPELIQIAQSKKQNKFHLLSKPYLQESDFQVLNTELREMEYLFFSTVLQHNNDASVNVILHSLAGLIKNTGFAFVVYENSEVQAPHVKGRTSSEYLDLFKRYWTIKEFETYKHLVHGEEHALTIMYV